MSVLRHTAYNLVAVVVPLAVTFLTLPLLLKGMGEARFGVMTIFAILLGYFNFFDFGLGTAMVQRIAASDPGDLAARREVFWTGAVLNLALSLVGTLLLVPVAWWYFATQMEVAETIRREVLAVLPWLVLALPVSLMTGGLRGTLQGTSRFFELNLVSVVGGVATQLTVLAVVLALSPALTMVIPAMLLGRLAVMIAYAVPVLRRVVLGWHPRLSRARARDLFSFGGWVAISNIVSPLMTALDRVLIGAQLGAEMVSHYTVPYQLGERTLAFPVAATDALFPVIAAADEDEIRAIAVRSLQVIPAVMALAMAGAILVIGPFLSVYVSPDFAAAAAPLGQVLFAGFALNSFGLCCYVCLRAGGKPRLVAIVHLVIILPFVAVMLALMAWLGPIGAAIAFVLRLIVDAMLLGHFSGVLRALLGLAIAPVLVLASAVAAARFGPEYPALWVGLGAVSLAAGGALLVKRLRDAGVDYAQLAGKLRARLSRGRGGGAGA